MVFLYDILRMYVIGIAKGALSSRAGSISFSFFMAIFPFILFILNLIPFIDLIPFLSIQNFDKMLLSYIDFLFQLKLKVFLIQFLKIYKINLEGGLLSSVFYFINYIYSKWSIGYFFRFF